MNSFQPSSQKNITYGQSRVLWCLLGSEGFVRKKKIAPISDRASVTDMLDLDSIPCLAFSNKKGQREDSTVCGRQDVAA